MEISPHKTEEIGSPTSSERSGIEIPGCRNHREITFSEQGISVKFLHNSRRNKKTSGFRLQSIEQVCTMSSLQNGRCPSFEINLGERRFYLQDRPEGRICRNSTSSSLQIIFNFLTSRYGLPVQNTGIWPQCSPPNFFKTNALCSGIIETERHPTSILSGRHLLSNEIQKRNAEEFERNSQALDESWILNQHQEEQLGTAQSTRIPRVSIRYIKDVNQTITTKTEKNSQQNKSSENATTPFTCRWFASLIRKMTAVIPSIGEALRQGQKIGPGDRWPQLSSDLHETPNMHSCTPYHL
ncbi:hypothetical protein G6F57_015678 [Rhizopus arrhizus]|nr:hypothetical protein G6F30_012796 [Rhizopus arrhizus]KAG0973319.1 hypothetical protein G6F29_012912 [Rhizopus arrhizus]KAG0975553.1 hypothetical protein G6F28_012890 [Rhizopus arrhizus]KAG1001391.1 hypothetical protein G6F27_012919 [Rhizopus arrhizus]KAG1015955.1 hypothetical protein G6F26_012888 [Rhizopus arrhizus]